MTEQTPDAPGKMKQVVWRKACACKSGATTGRTVMGPLLPAPNLKGIYESTVTRHCGPVCDACDTPWKSDAPGGERAQDEPTRYSLQPADAPMKQGVLQPGDVLHIGGIPVVLGTQAIVESHQANWPQIRMHLRRAASPRPAEPEPPEAEKEPTNAQIIERWRDMKHVSQRAVDRWMGEGWLTIERMREELQPISSQPKADTVTLETRIEQELADYAKQYPHRYGMEHLHPNDADRLVVGHMLLRDALTELRRLKGTGETR